MILNRNRLRTGLPAVDTSIPSAPPPPSKHVVVYNVDGDRWAACTLCPWTSTSPRELDEQVARHEAVSCGLVAR